MKPRRRPPQPRERSYERSELEKMPNVPFSIEPQTESDWCWAAVAASINNFFDPPGLTQCEVATDVLHLASGTCCGSPEKCNTPETLQRALTVTKNLGLPPF